MNEIIIFLGSLVLSFLAIYLYKLVDGKKEFAVGVDINKADQRKIPEGAGIALLIPIWAGIAISIFNQLNLDLIGWGLMISGFSLIGFVDDLKHKFLSDSVPWIKRALPIAIISLAFAFFYSANLVWWIPISLFIAGLASFQNTFAGLNGWEVGSGFIICLFLTYLLIGTSVFIPALVLCGSVLGLLLWNKFPASVFPGDSGTLLIGSAVAGLVVLSGKIELMCLVFLFFLPHIIDFFLLKLITNPTDSSQSRLKPYRLLPDGKLAIPEYGDSKTRYDFAKLILKIFGPLKEWQTVLIIWLVVAINCLLWLILLSKFY